MWSWSERGTRGQRVDAADGAWERNSPLGRQNTLFKCITEHHSMRPRSKSISRKIEGRCSYFGARAAVRVRAAQISVSAVISSAVTSVNPTSVIAAELSRRKAATTAPPRPLAGEPFSEAADELASTRRELHSVCSRASFDWSKSVSPTPFSPAQVVPGVAEAAPRSAAARAVADGSLLLSRRRMRVTSECTCRQRGSTRLRWRAK